jgi:type IV pilus assembly protein PilV
MKIQGKPASQRGSMLLEGLIAIMIFSMGILALAGLQANAVKNTVDAKYRTEAAFLANQIIGQMWVENPANLATYAHHATTNAGTCSFGGGASANANVLAWLGDATTPTPGTVIGNLPGATADKQQIKVDAGNLITVTICWQSPREATAHNYVAVAQVFN